MRKNQLAFLIVSNASLKSIFVEIYQKQRTVIPILTNNFKMRLAVELFSRLIQLLSILIPPKLPTWLIRLHMIIVWKMEWIHSKAMVNWPAEKTLWSLNGVPTISIIRSFGILILFRNPIPCILQWSHQKANGGSYHLKDWLWNQRQTSLRWNQ